METLIDLYKALLYRIDTSFVRYLHDQINWKSRLIAILGARGVGKTTLLLQHIKLFDDPSQSLYVLADDFYFSEHVSLIWRRTSISKEGRSCTLMKYTNTKTGQLR